MLTFGLDRMCRRCSGRGVERFSKKPCQLCGGGGIDRQSAVEEAAKLEGMDVAAINTADWQKVARDWFQGLPAGAEISSDDLTAAVGVPASKGAVGAAFRAASTRGEIRPVGFGMSGRSGRHRSRVLSWRKA